VFVWECKCEWSAGEVNERERGLGGVEPVRAADDQLGRYRRGLYGQPPASLASRPHERASHRSAMPRGEWPYAATDESGVNESLIGHVPAPM